MSRALWVVALALCVGLGTAALAADEAAGPGKTGTIKAVDAKAKTFELTLPARPLTFTVNDKTTITLDGKESTFDAAIKPELKATVVYTKVGEARVASKVAVTSAPDKK